ncbi:hypothetical protein JJB11_21480 [Ramlibacter ginsenosidimutans]|uniref:OmpA family protein n=1 Tax=Ramlibacter ginsenosidimutans TaxID=502333 RepID=A0A934TWR5_9BURK|nr:hypothetical protein [Ramlibacter ginsenosidimutans]MBK6008681.1 hypothetical protein [Ramlibacter ginsenosidimutans]
MAAARQVDPSRGLAVIVRRSSARRSRVPDSATGETGRRFKSATEATKELHEAYNAWTAGVSKLAVQAAFGCIAANWAVHGHAGIIANWAATLSVIGAVAYLASVLLVAWALIREYEVRYKYADEDKERWKREFESEHDTAWPYTDAIERVGRWYSRLGIYLPLASGALFVLSLFVPAARSASPSGSLGTVLPSPSSPVVLGPHDPAVGAEPTFFIMGLGAAFVAIGLVALYKFEPRRTAIFATMLGGSLLVWGGVTQRLQLQATFNLKPDALLKIVNEQVQSVSSPGPERIAFFDQFLLGESRRLQLASSEVIDVAQSVEVDNAVSSWLKRRSEGHDGMLLVIGATDRVRLGKALTQQYEANVGLARARAEVVKGAILQRCRARERRCDLTEEQVIVLVSGPRETAALSASEVSANGYPRDRRVDVWAFWTKRAATAIAR